MIIAGYNLAQVLIAIVVIAACCGLVMIALRQFGVELPGWVVQVFWIVVAAFVIIAAIRLVLGM